MDIRHPAYAARAPEWQTCRDTFEGEEAVKARGTTYLPALSAQHDDYAGYKRRAPFFPAMGRTVEGMVGCTIRKPPAIEGGGLDYWEDLTGFGVGLARIAEAVERELLIAGRCGILGDVVNGRPRMAIVRAEDVLSWTVAEGPEGPVLSMACVKVRRYREVSAGVVEAVEEIRTYRRGRDAVVVTIETDEGERIVPLGGTMDIPLWIVDLPSGSLDLLTPPKPPLLDLANVSLAHYRAGADLAHGLHWAALPTPYVAGKGKLADGMTIGSTRVWDLPDGASAGMLEASGTGLEELARLMTRYQGQMAAIGAATLVAEPNRVAETAESVRLKAGGDHSLLHTVVSAAETGITRAMQGLARWMMDPWENLGIELNRDWLFHRIPAQDAQVLLSMVQANAITPAQFADALARGEWFPEGQSFPTPFPQPGTMARPGEGEPPPSGSDPDDE